MTPALRDYQQNAVDAVLTAWLDNAGHVLVEAPTGSGKSWILAELMYRLHRDYSANVVCATHVAELLQQNCSALQTLHPDAEVGIYSAQLNRRDATAPLLFASIQSIFRKPEIIGKRQVLLIDEVQLLSRKADGMYAKLIAHMRSMEPEMRVAGASATLFRLDSGLLTDPWRGQEPLFESVVYRIGILELLNRGLLAPLVPYAPSTRLDTSGVRKAGGDFVQSELQRAVDIHDVNVRAVDELVRAGQDRLGWMAFCSGVQHAEHIRDLIRERGISCDMMLGETDKKERAEVVRKFKARETRCLVTVNTASVGFDARHVDLLALLRPTESKGLYLQQLGRGLRPCEGKVDCLVLDYCGSTAKFGFIDQMDGSKVEGASRAAPTKECPDCQRILATAIRVCPQCGYKFPEPELKIHATPAASPLFSDQSEPEWMDVEGVLYRRHSKPQTPDSLRIDYNSGLTTYSHWVSLEHPQAGGFARRWWAQNSFSGVAPRSVDEALAATEDLRVPGRIQVVQQGKFWRIIHWDYSVPAGRVIPTMRDVGVSGRPKWWRRSA